MDESGVRADPDKIQAIQNILAPTSVSEVRRFLGTVNQMSKFAPNLAEETKPLRDLLIKGNHWTWEAPQSLHENKADVDNQPAFFDPTLKTVVSVCRRVFVRPRRNTLATTIDRRAETSWICVPVDDAHRTEVRTNRKGSLSAYLGL